LILALLATLGAIVTAFVLYPVFTEATAAGPAPELDETALALADLSDKKAMLYEAIQDLDFEKDSGKISDSDYQTARNDYLAQVSVVMEKMDALAPPKPDDRKKTPKEPRQESAFECARCGASNPKGSNFCLECGAGFETACAACGESLPTKAKFCNACGEKVSA
jgi:hypothetical protein